MRLNVKREYIHKVGPVEAFLKIFRGLFNHENRIRPVYKVLLSHENRIRALEGLGPVTEAQFLATVEGLDQVTKAQFVDAVRNL